MLSICCSSCLVKCIKWHSTGKKCLSKFCTHQNNLGTNNKQHILSCCWFLSQDSLPRTRVFNFTVRIKKLWPPRNIWEIIYHSLNNMKQLSNCKKFIWLLSWIIELFQIVQRARHDFWKFFGWPQFFYLHYNIEDEACPMNIKNKKNYP